MIYLRKFNESLENYIEQLKDFCEENLVYLLDEGFQLKYDTHSIYFPEIRTIHHDGDAGVNVKIICPNYRKSILPNTHWSDIKDYIIPFLQRLCNEYQNKIKNTHSMSGVFIFYLYLNQIWTYLFQ